MTIVMVVYLVLGVLFVIASIVQFRCDKKAEKILDEIDRETLGQKYYDELWGVGSFEFGKNCKSSFKKRLDRI